MYHSFNPPWFKYPNSIKGRVAIMELLIVLFSPFSYFIFIGLMYNSSYFFKKHSVSLENTASWNLTLPTLVEVHCHFFHPQSHRLR
jgi:hypothetical protein